MSIVTLKQILAIIISILSSIFAIMNFLRKKTDKEGKLLVTSGHKVIIFLIALVVVVFVSLSTYLEFVNRDQVYANLILTVADPLIVNKDGSQRDSFLLDSDYCVVQYSDRFVVNATVELENIYTREKYVYHPVSDNGSFTFANFKSGKYSVNILSGKEIIYQDTIILDRSNVVSIDDTDTWQFTAFVFDDFYENAVGFSIYLAERQADIVCPLFTLCNIDSEPISFALRIFSSEIDLEHNAKLSGQFYGYPGKYVLSNAMGNATMDQLVFDVGA